MYSTNSTEDEIIDTIRNSVSSRSYDWLNSLFGIPTMSGSTDIASLAGVRDLDLFYRTILTPQFGTGDILMELENIMGRPFIGYGDDAMIQREVNTEASRFTSRRRERLRNNVRLDNNPFLGESPDGLIQRARDILNDDNNKARIGAILKDDPASHVTSYEMKYGKTDMTKPLVVYKTLREIREYYKVLSCTFFSFELLFARNELFRFIRSGIGASCIEDEIRGKDGEPPRRPIPMFLHTAQLKTNMISIRLAQAVDKMFGEEKLSVNHAVTFRQMLGMCEAADIELVIYNNARMVSLCKRMTLEDYHGVCKIGMKQSSEDEEFFQRIPSMLHFVNTEKQMARCENLYHRHPVILVMSQVYSVVKHIEPVLSHDLAREVTRLRSCPFRANVKLRYNDCREVKNDFLYSDYVSAKDFFNKNFELSVQENSVPYNSVYERPTGGVNVAKAMWAKPRATAVCQTWAQYHYWEKEIIRHIMAYQVSIQCIEDIVNEKCFQMELEGMSRSQINREKSKIFSDEGQKITNQYVTARPFDLQISPGFFSDPQTIEALRESEEHSIVDMSHLLGHFITVTEEKKLARLSTFIPSNSPISVLRNTLYKPQMDDRFSPRAINSINGIQQYTFVADVGSNVRESIKKLLEINVYRAPVSLPKVGDLLVNQQPYSSEIAHAKEQVLEKMENAISERSISTEEKKKQYEEAKRHIEKNATKENLAHVLDRSNTFVDLLFRSSTKKRESAINFVRRSFSSIDDSKMEVAKVYDSVLDETPIPITRDAHRYNSRPDPAKKLVEIDMSKDYLSTAMGSASLAVLPDLYDDTANFVGILNPRMEKFSVQAPSQTYDPEEKYTDPSDYLVHSHIADCGKVLINIDVSAGKKLMPEAFAAYSPWTLFRGGRRFVWAALVIDLCEQYARKETEGKEIPRWGSLRDMKLYYYRKLQHEVFRVQGGFFDMQMSYRKIIQKALKHDVALENVDIGSEFTAVTERRFVLSRFNYAYDYEGTTLKQVPVYRERDSYKRLRPCMVKAEHNTAKMYKAFAENVIKFHKMIGPQVPMASNYPGVPCNDTIPTGKYINNMFRIFIGSSKYLVPRGAQVRYTNELNHFSIEGNKKRKFETADLKDVRRLSRKTKCYVDVVKDLVHANDVMVMPIPKHKERYLVSSYSATAIVSRLGYSAWRDTILALRFAFMSKLAVQYKPYRVKTDSILVEESQVKDVETYLESVLYPTDICESKPDYMIPSMFPPWKVEDVYPMDKENDKARILQSIMSSPEEPPIRAAIGEHAKVRDMLDGMGEPLEEKKDSDLFFKWFQENAPVYIQGKENGKKLHRELWPRVTTDPVLKDLYDKYSKFRSEYLLQLDGAILVGEPGAGKSTTVKEMVSNTNNAAVVAPMHSILRGYHGCGALVATMHSFFGVSLDLASASKNPETHLRMFWSTRGQSQKKIKVLFIDEAEMASKSFEELIRIQNLVANTKVFIVGDPNQSAPMFGRGFDMFGNVARVVSSDNVFRFDMQFRNYDFEYMEKVHEFISNGQVDKLLCIPEETYYPSHVECEESGMRLPNEKTDEVVHNTIENIVDSLVKREEPEWTISVQNYKVMGMIWLEVYRRWSLRVNPREFLVLARSGSTESKNKAVGDVVVAYDEVDENGYRGKQSKSRVDRFRELTTKSESLLLSTWDVKSKLFRDQEKSFSWRNGPSGRSFLVGLPLVFYPGATFVSTNRFQSAHQHKALDGERLDPEVMVQLSLYTYIGSYEDEGMIKDPLGKEGSNCKLKYRVLRFQCGWSDEETHITEMEAAMYLIPSFLVLHSFCIGATLNKFLVLRVSQEEGHVKSYDSLYHTLRWASMVYGKDASFTETARAMCVARTRVRNPADCIVVDMPVHTHRFWETYWRSGNNFVVFDSKESKENYKHFERMRMNILIGKSAGLVRKEGKTSKGLTYPSKKKTDKLPILYAREFSTLSPDAWTGSEGAESFPSRKLFT